MRISKIYIVFLAFLAIQLSIHGQFDPGGISRIEDGKLQLSLDIRWTDSQKKEVEKLFNLDSTVWVKISSGTSGIYVDSVEWDLKVVSRYMYELSRSLEQKAVFHFNENDVFLVGDNRSITPGYVDNEKIIFGTNNFKKPQCFQYNHGEAHFYLPGYLKYGDAYIAGSFNNWDPAFTPLQKVDSGWVVSLPLSPGKYFYKYLIDGNWMKDPNNNLREDDGQGNINSAVYCPNHQFELKGYSKARKVNVAGTFNNWNRKDLKMYLSADRWILPVYLRDGTYSYKFIVDDQWLPDPGNRFTRTDVWGNVNSVIGRGEEYIFRLNGFTDAEKVTLAGNFNNWNPDELMMEKTVDGWLLHYQFAPGNYEYKFIVDGNWMPDPANPFTKGSGDGTNSCLAFKSNYTFILHSFQDAAEVRITGSFNIWSSEGFRMIKEEGTWIYPIYLSPGKHLYKLIVDGKWITDPTNKLWEENEFGTGNSVIWIMDSKF
jgi:hypothetical protein